MGQRRTYVAAAAFALVGMGLVVGAFFAYQKGSATTRWPNVSGEVVGKRFEQHLDPEANEPNYEPIVEYRYVVDGQSYAGERVVPFSESYGSRPQAQEVLDRYPVGQSVTVYYDPKNPGSAVLEPKIQPLVPIGLLVFAATLLVFAGMALREARAERKPTS